MGFGVFLAILVYGSVLGTLRTYHSSKLQPIAVTLKADAGSAELSGLYVAETSDRVYIADVDHCTRDKNLRLTPTRKAKRGRIIEVPRASMSSLAIGNLARVQEAKAAGPQLLAELREREHDRRAA